MQPTTPLAQFSPTTATRPGYSHTQNGVTLTEVQPDELTSTQLGTLLRSDNPLVQHMAQNAHQFASARGAGLTGSLYSDAATRASFDQMTPIAEANANQYADVRNRNQEALNTQNFGDRNNSTSVQVAGIGANATLTANRDRIREEGRQFDLGRVDRLQEREWQLADANTSARAAQRGQLFDSMISAVFSDPSYWRDPEGAIGLFNTYGSNLDSLMQNLFPEYYETDQQGNPTGGNPPPRLRGDMP